MTATPTRPTTAPRSPAPHRAGGGASSFGSTIDPVKVLRRHVWLLVGVAIVGVFLGGVAYFVADRYYPRYSESVHFELQPGLRDATDVAAADLTGDEMVVRLARTEIERLKQRSIIRRALARESVRATTWAQPYLETGNVSDQAVDDLLENLRADVIRNTNLFIIEWSAPNALDVPTVLNAIASEYLAQRQRDDEERYEATLRTFNAGIQNIDREILRLSEEISSRIENAQLTSLQDSRDVPEMVGAKGLETQINDVTIELSMTSAQIANLERQLKEAVREVTDDERRRAEDDPNIRSLTASVNDLRVSLGTARDRFAEQHPQVVTLGQRLRAAEQEREEAIKTWVIRDRQARYKMAVQRKEQLESALKDLEDKKQIAKSRLETVTGEMRKVDELRNRVKLLESQRQAMQESMSEANMMKTRADARRALLVKAAEVPRQKSFPRLQVFVPLGAIAALVLALGLIFLRELLDQRVKSSRDLAVIPGAKVVGSVPDLADDPTKCASAERAVREHPGSVVAESYRHANAHIMREMNAGGHTILAVVGGMPGAGTTTVVSNLGATDAAAGKRVLLIDANFRRPALPAALGVAEDGPGLGDLLFDKAAVDESIVDVGDGLHLMHAGTPASRVLERLNSPKFDSILAELRPRYDVILIDAPPAMVAGEALVLASKADAAILVVRANQAQRGLVARLVHQLADMRCQLIGVLLNRPRETAGGYLKTNYAAMAEYSRGK